MRTLDSTVLTLEAVATTANQKVGIFQPRYQTQYPKGTESSPSTQLKPEILLEVYQLFSSAVVVEVMILRKFQCEEYIVAYRN
jgi:hypothetical protein